MNKRNLPGNLNHADRVWFENCLYEILDAAIEADYATLGNIQLFSTSHNALQIVAQRGFDLAFINHFEFVSGYDGSVCGRAFNEKKRVMISDVGLDASFGPHRSIADASGFRAVQSTPFFSRGVVCGVLSTHFPTIHYLSDSATATLDACAVQLGKLVENFETR